MSPQDVEIVRRWMELANRGDVVGLAALTSEDVACFPADDQPESAPFRGREALVRYAQG